MIKDGRDRLVQWLIKNGAIKLDDKELYIYAIHCLSLSFTPLLLAVIIAAIMGNPVKGLIIIMPFTCMRRYSGGHHAKNTYLCCMESIIIMALAFYISKYIYYNWVLIVLLIVSIFQLVFFSPVEHQNKQLNNHERAHYKRVVTGQIIINLALICILFISNIQEYAVCIILGIILAAIMQMPVVIKCHFSH